MFYIQLGNQDTSSDKISFTKRLISYYVEQKKQERILIVDVNNSYPEINSIKFDSETFDEFLRSNDSVGIYRVRLDGLSAQEGAMQYDHILSNYKNGLLVCENPFVFFDRIPNSLAGLLATSIQRYCDILINLTDLKKAVAPKLFQNADCFILRKCTQKIEPLKPHLGSLYDLFLYANDVREMDKSSIFIDLRVELIYTIKEWEFTEMMDDFFHAEIV